MNWLVCPPCDGVRDILGDEEYTFDNIEEAPWYDVESPATHRFLGAHALSVENMTDSTREAEVAEGILDGGVVGRVRNATRRMRVRAILSAIGEDALEAGFSWLDAALRPGRCGLHGDACGAADTRFFVSCPPARTDITMPDVVMNDPITNLAVNPSMEGTGAAVAVLTNLATNPSMETPGAAVVLATNLATNPSFEATTAATVEVRRNLLLNPKMDNLVTGWAVTGTGVTQTAQAGGTRIDFASTLGALSPVLYNSTVVASAASETAYAGIDVTVPAGFPAVTVSLGIRGYLTGGASPDGGTANQNSASVTIQPGETKRLVTPVATALATTVGGWRLWLNLVSPGVTAGGQITVKNAIIEKWGVNTPPYFDGTTVPAGDFTHAWTGTVNASASVQYGIQVPTVSGVDAAVIQSTDWMKSGVRSLRIIPISATSNSYAVVVPTLTVGKTYTVLATSRLTAPQTGVTFRPRALVVWPGTGGVETIGASAPNAAGVTEHRLTFTVAGTGYAIQLYNGAAKGGGDVWWDDLLVVEGVYTGPYFDGSTEPKVRRNLAKVPVPTASYYGLPNNTGLYPISFDTTGGRRPDTGASLSTRTISTPNDTLASAYNFGTTGWNVAGRIPVSAGQVITVSAYVKSTVADSRAGFTSFFFDAANAAVGPNVVAPLVTITDGGYSRITQTVTVPAGATNFGISFTAKGPVGYVSVGGEQVWITDLLFEAAPTAGEYFDGNYPVTNGLVGKWEGAAHTSASYLTDPDLVPQWTGAFNASTSVYQGAMVAGAFADGTAPIVSVHWASHGDYSMRLLRTRVGDAYAVLSLSGTGTASKTWTAMIRTRVTAPLVMTGHTHLYEAGGTYREVAKLIPSGTALTGEQEWRVTFTTPADMAAAGFQLAMRTGPNVGDAVYFDDLVIVAGAYAGPYFDGDTEPTDTDFTIGWTGTPHASTSAISATSVANVATTATSVMYSTTHAPSSGSRAARYRVNASAATAIGIPVIGFQPTVGVIYTLLGRVRSNSRDQVFSPRIGGLNGDAFFAPMGAWTQFQMTLDAGSGVAASTGLFLAADSGHQPGDLIDIDMVALVAGDYTGRYFDGSMTDNGDPTQVGSMLNLYDWTGTPDASTSTHTTGQVYAVPDPVAYQDTIERLIRHQHTVTCVSGPIVEQKLHRGDTWGYIVEFVLVAAVPWVFGITKPIVLEPGLPVVVQDVPFNLVPYPSAELPAGSVIAATNYSTNPSVETGLTGWSSAGSTMTAQTVLSQSDTATGGLASVGTKSARARFTATSASAVAGSLRLDNTVTFPAAPAGLRMSVNMWAVAQLVSGTAVISQTRLFAIWRQAGATVRTDELGTVPVGGGAISAKSIAVPTGADSVYIRAEATLASWSSGAVVDLYGDAVTVSVP